MADNKNCGREAACWPFIYEKIYMFIYGFYPREEVWRPDVFYGLTFDAPFFAFVHQHVKLWLSDTYPNLELGTYYHSADNSHFYERHFELADRILKEDVSDNEEYEMNITEPMFTVNKNVMELTSAGETFIKMLEDFDPSSEDSLFYLRLLSPFLGITRVETIEV
jgi:hypothetical protein